MTCHEPRTNEIKKRTRKNLHETTPHNGLEEEQVKTGGARASAVVFRKFVF